MTGVQKLESEPLEYEDPDEVGLAMMPLGQEEEEDSGSSEVCNVQFPCNLI